MLECLRHDVSDEVIFEYAISINAIIVTKDEDFAIRSDASGAPPSILWLRLGNCRNAPLIGALDMSMPTAFEAFERGERIVEIRG